MPRANKRKSQLQGARAHREPFIEVSDSSDPSDDEYRMDADDEEFNFKDKLSLTDSGDIAEMCKLKCGTKYLSTLLYMSLRFFNIKWEDIDEYLNSIGVMTAESSNKWATLFVKGDYEVFSNDLRGGKRTDSFYDTFPEIEADGKSIRGPSMFTKNQQISRHWTWLSSLIQNIMN